MLVVVLHFVVVVISAIFLFASIYVHHGDEGSGGMFVYAQVLLARIVLCSCSQLAVQVMARCHGSKYHRAEDGTNNACKLDGASIQVLGGTLRVQGRIMCI